MLAHLTWNTRQRPCSLYDMSTGVNSSNPINSTVSMGHGEDEWTVRAHNSDYEFEDFTNDGRYGNVLMNSDDAVVDAELFQDGEEV